MPDHFGHTTVHIIDPAMLTGNWWEQDGACWEAERDPTAPEDWRWCPKNWRAFAKEAPEGPMVDHIPFGLFNG